MQAADEVIAGKHDDQFPLFVWQTGSGTQTNMNVNEVISNRAIELAGGERGTQEARPPERRRQHVAVVERHVPDRDAHRRGRGGRARAGARGARACATRSRRRPTEFADIVKIGRTHLQDAMPLTLGQEFCGYVAQLDADLERIELVLPGPLRARASAAPRSAPASTRTPSSPSAPRAKIAELTGLPFVSAPNKFAALAAHDALVFASGALKTLAVSLMKIANDIRWLASGPRCGLGELILPENEPGSSIMPGKVNPTQCEAMTMVCVQVLGNDAAIGDRRLAGQLRAQRVQAGDDLQLPALGRPARRRVRLVPRVRDRGHAGRTRSGSPSTSTNSLMLVTALNPHIGYDNAAKIAKKAHKDKAHAQGGGGRARPPHRRGVRPPRAPGEDDPPGAEPA